MTNTEPSIDDREHGLVTTLVELADSLVGDFDVVELLTLLTSRCVKLLAVDASGIMLVAPTGDIRVVASSSERSHLLELFELQAEEGPCVDAILSGRPVSETDLTAADRWPTFAASAVSANYRSVHAVPLRLRGNIIGALNLFLTGVGGLPPQDQRAAQAFADIATIAILQHRVARESQLLAENLQIALNSRITIEQAKGMVAERLGIDVASAFDVLRAYSRDANRRVAEVSAEFIAGALSTADLNRD